MILGGVMEAALLIAHSEDPARRRDAVGRALDDLLAGLRSRRRTAATPQSSILFC